MKSVKADNETIAKAVAPFVGAWIEIIYMKILRERKLSLRSSERGLKLSWDAMESFIDGRSVRRSVD